MTNKLTPAQVEEIKAAYQAGDSQATIAARYGISKGGVAHHTRTYQRVQKFKERSCKSCGTTMTIRTDSRKRYCNTTCRNAEDQADFVAEVEWLAGTDSWESIAKRLGLPSRGALARRLHRLGAVDLAVQADRVPLYEQAA